MGRAGVRLRVLWGKPTDPAEFDRHYREVHIALARELPGLRAYTLSRTSATDGDPDAHYLITELDFDDLDSLQAAINSPAGEAAAADGAVLSAGATVSSTIYELETVL
jgi:uncharacterized protein (TIGR02118 family)